MPDTESATLDRVFHALADPTRREILRRVAAETCTVTQLAAPFDMSLAAVSKHLKVLERARLLTRRRDGRIHRCSLDPRPLRDAATLLQHYQEFWEKQLASLDWYLTQVQPALHVRTPNIETRDSMTASITTTQPVIVKRTVRAPRERVFEAWTNPRIMRQWFFPNASWTAEVTVDLQVGGRYIVRMHPHDSDEVHEMKGEYREIVPPEKVVFTWNAKGFVENTVVTVELRDLGERTEIVLTHDLLPTDDLRERHGSGWNGCLDNLEKVLQA